jgi:hypothetical protein
LDVGSRVLPLTLAMAALAAGSVGLGGLAFWLGLLAIPAAAAAAFVAASDTLEGRPTLLRAVTSGFSLALLVLACAARSNAVSGTPRLATWALFLALLSYSVPAVAWMLEPVKVTRTRPERRRRPRPATVETTAEACERAA